MFFVVTWWMSTLIVSPICFWIFVSSVPTHLKNKSIHQLNRIQWINTKDRIIFCKISMANFKKQKKFFFSYFLTYLLPLSYSVQVHLQTRAAHFVQIWRSARRRVKMLTHFAPRSKFGQNAPLGSASAPEVEKNTNTHQKMQKTISLGKKMMDLGEILV